MMKKSLFFAGLTFFLLVFPKINLVPVTGSLVSIRIEDIVILLILGWLVWRLVQGKLKYLVSLSTLKVWSVFVLWAGFSTLISWLLNLSDVSIKLGLFHFGRLIEFVVIAAFFAVEIDSAQTKRAIVWALALAVVFEGTYALLQLNGFVPYFSTLTSLFPGEAINFSTIGVVIGTFGGHYDFGIFCAWTVAACLLLASRGSMVWQNNQARLLWPIVMLIGLLGLMGSGARSAYLGLAVFLGLYGLMIRKKWITLLSLGGVLVLTGFFLIGALSNFLTPVTVNDLAVPVDFSLVQRLGKWLDLIRSLGLQVVTGKGLSSFGEAVDGYYVRLIGEAGLIGLVLFGAFLTHAARELRRGLESHSINADIARIALAGIIVLTVQGMFIDIFISSKIMFLLAMLLGTYWAKSQDQIQTA